MLVDEVEEVVEGEVDKDEVVVEEVVENELVEEVVENKLVKEVVEDELFEENVVAGRNVEQEVIERDGRSNRKLKMKGSRKYGLLIEMLKR